MIRSPHFRGHTGPGREYTRGEPDWREQLDINTEAEAIPSRALVHPRQRPIGPNLWPEAMPEFRPTPLACRAEATRLGIEVSRAIVLALGRPEETFESLRSPDPTRLLKIIPHPGPRDDRKAPGGWARAKDGGLVTIPLQDEVPPARARGRGLSVDRLNPLFHDVGRNRLKSRPRSLPMSRDVGTPNLTTGGEYTLPERAEAY